VKIKHVEKGLNEEEKNLKVKIKHVEEGSNEKTTIKIIYLIYN
jgi:hypothetical protein